MRWSAWKVESHSLPHQLQGGLPSISAALFCRYCWVCFLLPAMCVMLLAPLLRCGCFQCYISSVVCASPHFQLVTVAGGLFRTVSRSPFVSLGNAALATYPNNLSRNSSWVVGRASSTHVPVCYANTVQSRMWPWSYSVVVHTGFGVLMRPRYQGPTLVQVKGHQLFAYALNDGNTEG
jgi:hypothetical protein